jgi:mono/diheme cytochrome c family protein
MNMQHQRRAIAALAAFALGAPAIATHAADAAKTKSAQERPASRADVERGRYLLIVGNCNDCHTANFPERSGNVPESDWLLGNSLGLRGPWGTTYASNLRVTASKVSEADWVKLLKTLKTRPPMPWFNVNQWKEEDAKALYHYIKQLGPVGQPAKAPVPPGQEPPQPYVQWPMPPK